MRGLWRSIRVEGLNLERLVRQAGEENLIFRRMKRSGRTMTAQVQETDLSRLAELAYSGGWCLTTGQRVGSALWLDRLKAKWLQAVCVCIALAAVAAALQVVWRVDIDGAGTYAADAAMYLKEQRICPGAWKKSIDLAVLRDQLEWRYPKVAWVECAWRGTTLDILFHEGTPLGDAVTHEGQGDLIAGRAGIIDSVVVLAGTAVVHAGDVVQEGQLLISGVERTEKEGVRPVAARGMVMARVWDGAAVHMPARETTTVYTGRTHETTTAACPWFTLGRKDDGGFDVQDVSIRRMPLGGLFFPFYIQRETSLEATVQERTRDLASLKAEAGDAALKKLRENVGFSDDFVDKWVYYCMIEDEVLEAVAVGERVIDIAVAQRNDG